jgi:peptidoglycan hydrolase-like protein with peptidoglycan-binding domain
MNDHKWLSSAMVLAGVVAISALPILAQVGSQSEKPGGGSAAGQGQSGTKDSLQGQTTREDQGQIQSPGGMKEGQGQVQSRSGKQGSEASGMTRSGQAGAGNEDVKKVQQALKDKGQDPGAIDGILGPKTKEALRAFQQQQGLSATGTLDNQTKEALGLEQGGSAKSGARSSKSGAASSRSGGASSGLGSSRPGDSSPGSSRSSSGASEGATDSNPSDLGGKSGSR